MRPMDMSFVGFVWINAFRCIRMRQKRLRSWQEVAGKYNFSWEDGDDGEDGKPALIPLGNGLWKVYRRGIFVVYIKGETRRFNRTEDGVWKEHRCGDFPIQSPGEVRGFTIKENTITDLATVPWFIRIFLPGERTALAGVAHDHLYDKDSGEISRKVADGVFWEVLMQERFEIAGKGIFASLVVVARKTIFFGLGCPLAYLAVRGFGWRRFKR